MCMELYCYHLVCSNKTDHFPTTSDNYSLIWDNVVKLKVAKLQSSQDQSKMHMWAMVLAVKNRVPYMGPPDTKETIPATSIPHETFLMNGADWTLLKTYMAILVERILVDNLPYFKVRNFKTVVLNLIIIFF